MSNIHPSVGEGRSYESMLKFWDDYSDQYSGMQQGDIPDQVIGRLQKLGALCPRDEVLEIGSGPGTYSLKLAPVVRHLTCLDTSPRMLDRLFASAGEKGLGNISRLDMDWKDYALRKNVDVCIATLCPGSGSPQSIERMEAVSRRSCVLVSWVMNHGDDLNADLWKKMGKDYGYGFRGSTAVEDWLRDNGRKPVVEFFDTRIKADIPLSTLVAKETSAFRAYGVEADIEGMIREIYGSDLDGDILHYDVTNRMKMICWESR